MKKIVRLNEEGLKALVEEKLNEILNDKETNQTNNMPSPHLVDITDKDEIAQYMDAVYNLLAESYANIGGFLGAQNKIELYDKTDLLTLYTDGRRIYSAAVYNNRRGGAKLFGIGGGDRKQSPIGAQGVHLIIQRDIREWPNGWYWCEASGAIEFLFKKHGGDNIPSIFAPELLGIQNLKTVDEYHYERKLGKNQQSFIKTIFGFRDESIFNKVADYQKQKLQETVGYIEHNMNKVNEAIEDEAQKADNEAFLACNIIISISDTMCEMMSTELIPEQVAYIKQSIETLQRYPNYKNAETSIHLGQYMLDSYTLLTLHKFNENS